MTEYYKLYSEIAPQCVGRFLRIAESLPVFISERLFLYPKHDTDLLPVTMNTCNMCLQLFLFSTTYFLHAFAALSKLSTFHFHQIQDDLISLGLVTC